MAEKMFMRVSEVALSVMIYKKEERAKEVKALEKSITKLQNQQLDVRAVE